MRRTPLVGLFAGLALALTACGSGDGGSTTAADGELTGRGPITLVSGKDRSGNMQKMVAGWNAAHPKEPVRIIELPDEPNDQRQQLIQNATTKSDAYTVLSLDVVWTAEFAANRWLTELPKDKLDTSKLLPATVKTGEYRGRLFAMPVNSDAGLLYYRTDLLKKAGIDEPPTTWAQMWEACDKVRALPEGEDVDCYLTEVGKTEGLTVSAAEAVNSAGGVFFDASGQPAVNTPQARAGMDFLVNAIKDGRMPRAALTLDGEGGRRHFQSGKLLFHRQWPYQYELANADDGSSKVAGKFAVAPIPGPNGPGAANLGGHNYAISAFAKNKATALDFIKYMTDPAQQKADSLATSKAPTVAALYDDPELIEKYPYLPALKEAIQKAQSRPVVVRYGDVTAAIQSAFYDALGGKTPPDRALTDLQSKLAGLATP
ncbi:ABC transporter substrate-binding protein [Thermomonospora cellulosilytica]|uniref:Multiple sugar transport system substrate-binding protein n=1 Tax=Thermomonospora cellulosilytica TaxID=1411118 RepID=A0A7W3MZ66_9ACTN|nr:ABC transporter substrate-binding protein [Thermomonospora cellulosilytica]MBA9004587.1 multiple sugar transport system substrate-binding protein [Thermomonospora cellulosilytica]